MGQKLHDGRYSITIQTLLLLHVDWCIHVQNGKDLADAVSCGHCWDGGQNFAALAEPIFKDFFGGRELAGGGF